MTSTQARVYEGSWDLFGLVDTDDAECFPILHEQQRSLGLYHVDPALLGPRKAQYPQLRVRDTWYRYQAAIRPAWNVFWFLPGYAVRYFYERPYITELRTLQASNLTRTRLTVFLRIKDYSPCLNSFTHGRFVTLLSILNNTLAKYPWNAGNEMFNIQHLNSSHLEFLPPDLLSHLEAELDSYSIFLDEAIEAELAIANPVKYWNSDVVYLSPVGIYLKARLVRACIKWLGTNASLSSGFRSRITKRFNSVFKPERVPLPHDLAIRTWVPVLLERAKASAPVVGILASFILAINVAHFAKVEWTTRRQKYSSLSYPTMLWKLYRFIPPRIRTGAWEEYCALAKETNDFVSKESEIGRAHV